MGSFSIWHWLIVLVYLGVPIFFIVKGRPEGPNRFGSVAASPLDFGAALASFFRNYANFSGRASRSEYWYSFLFIVLISAVLGAVDPTDVLSGIWGLAILLPTLALAARRLHDTNRSGWLQLIGFSVVGAVALIVWYCTRASEAYSLSIEDEKVSADPVNPTNMVSLDILERLAKMKANGTITDEDYEIEKKKILGGLR